MYNVGRIILSIAKHYTKDGQDLGTTSQTTVRWSCVTIGCLRSPTLPNSSPKYRAGDLRVAGDIDLMGWEEARKNSRILQQHSKTELEYMARTLALKRVRYSGKGLCKVKKIQKIQIYLDRAQPKHPPPIPSFVKCKSQFIAKYNYKDFVLLSPQRVAINGAIIRLKSTKSGPVA